MTVTKYGVISDVHEDPKLVIPAIESLKREGVDKLLVNGDIGGNYGSLEKSQGYTGFILSNIAESGLESFVQPGSHETLLGYGPVIDHFTDKYSNVVDTMKVPKIEYNGHTLVFLPGSDFLCGGQYQIGNQEGVSTGMYLATEKGMAQVDGLESYVGFLKRGFKGGAMQYQYMNDLKKHVSDPEKTVVVCHVPRKFDNLDEAVDMAEFGEAVIDFPLQGEVVKKGSVFPYAVAEKLSEAGLPVELKNENRGNEDLRKLYDELGVTKAVSGHFHESAHRANDLNGDHVPEGEFVEELFWMGSYLDKKKIGVLTVGDDCRVSYRNIDLS
jgi:hypothetical protein